MTTPFDREELLRLIDALCAEEISTEDHTRLEQILGESGGARQLYFDYVDHHLALKCATQEPSAELTCASFPAEALPNPPAAPSTGAAYWKYAAVAGTAFALSLLVQFVLFPRSDQVASAPSPTITESTSVAGYVATLGSMSDCKWNDVETSHPEGWRLMPGELHLRTGVAEIRFDSGATLIIEGPTRLDIESAHAATLKEGRIVLRGDEVSEGFSLNTPDATLVDIGTEYAVSVEQDGQSEVHVFDGKVLRHVRGPTGTGQAEELNAGEAKRFGAKSVARVPLGVDRFVRRVPKASHQPRNVDADLLVADRFEYAVRSLPAEAAGDDGVGWSKPWRGSREKPGLKIRSLAVNDPSLKEILGPGALWHEGIGEIGRIAGESIRLDVDAVYYVSFVFQRGTEQERKFLQFRLHQNKDWDPKRMLRMGIAHPNLAFLDLGTEAVRTHLPLDGDRPYLLVAKIVAGRDRPDQAFLTIYSMNGPVEADEPRDWTLSTSPVNCDGELDDFWFLFRGEGTQWVDELRIGRTWQSVTAPYRKHNIAPTLHLDATTGYGEAG